MTLGRSRTQKWDIYWSPEGRKIATVEAITARKAIRKAPKPYRQYLGEMYAVEEGAVDRYLEFSNLLDSHSSVSEADKQKLAELRTKAGS